MVTTTRSAAFEIYKKSAAAQVSLIRPTYNEKGYVERTGAIFIEASPSKGEDANGNISYNWADKISFSLGVSDFALLLDDFSKSLVHEYQGSVKTLQFQPGSGKYEGTYMLSLREKAADGSERKVSVPVTAGEARIFGKLLEAAIAKVLGW